MYARVHIVIRGAVQGVGFRPFVYRLATELGIHGCVLNSAEGVVIDAENEAAVLESFLLRLPRETPPRSSIQSFEYSYLDPIGFHAFEIRKSDARGERLVSVLPDIATCPDCLNDITNPSNRRFGYPFTNCTNCGPRFSIITALPYDRPNTSMLEFVMCPVCQAEYDNPLDRRFHAQPTACPVCGPHVELWDPSGAVRSRHADALDEAIALIAQGRIVAVKGLGGFHLIADARNEETIATLRTRKRREEKPFALMAPDLSVICSVCEVGPLEERLLTSPEAPIVLLRKRSARSHDLPIAPSVAPHNPWLGFMLPSNPLHHIMMKKLGSAVVATSGNLTDEPICTDEHEALHRLHGIADAFLVHNRPIIRYVDDSIARVLMGRELVLRRARGYAPFPIALGSHVNDAIAFGAHLKNTVAVARGENAFISQHIGDLESEQSLSMFRATTQDLGKLFHLTPRIAVADMHPDYASTKHAQASGLPVVQIQHHFAHIAACMAENHVASPLLGISWDGTGWGPDGTIWGGEFLHVTKSGWRRAAAFLPFPLPGGEAAIKEPRRTALGLLFTTFGESALDMTHIPVIASFLQSERTLFRSMLVRNLNSPRTSSVGRLFDGVAALLGLRLRTSYEGQAAMELEFASDGIADAVAWDIPVLPSSAPDGPLCLDWRPMIRDIIESCGDLEKNHLLAARFHASLVKATVSVAAAVGEQRVVLSGGCFQNVTLTTGIVQGLRAAGHLPYWHQRVPPNDGGISLGQIFAACVLDNGMSSKDSPSQQHER